MWIKDPKTGEKSVTLTMMMTGFVTALGKLLLAGATVGSIKMGSFSGAEFAAVVGALGSIYAFRKHTDKDKA